MYERIFRDYDYLLCKSSEIWHSGHKDLQMEGVLDILTIDVRKVLNGFKFVRLELGALINFFFYLGIITSDMKC